MADAEGEGRARPGSARPPARGSWSAPGPARAAAAALAPGFGGAGAPRRSHGPGDLAALAHAQCRLLGQQQRGEPRARGPGRAERPTRQAWAASVGLRAPGMARGDGERSGAYGDAAVRPHLGSRTAGNCEDATPPPPTAI